MVADRDAARGSAAFPEVPGSIAPDVAQVNAVPAATSAEAIGIHSATLAELRAMKGRGELLTRPNAPDGPDLGAAFWDQAQAAENEHEDDSVWLRANRQVTRPAASGASAVVEALFADLRDRRFLKWLFDANPDRAGPILHERDGTPLYVLSAEAQADIRAAWIKIVEGTRPGASGDGSGAEVGRLGRETRDLRYRAEAAERDRDASRAVTDEFQERLDAAETALASMTAERDRLAEAVDRQRDVLIMWHAYDAMLRKIDTPEGVLFGGVVEAVDRRYDACFVATEEALARTVQADRAALASPQADAGEQT